MVFSVTFPLPLAECGEPPHAGRRLLTGTSRSGFRIPVEAIEAVLPSHRPIVVRR